MYSLPTLFLSLVSLVSPTESTPPATETQIQELVQKLGDRSFRTREAAASKIVEIGSRSIESLKKGTKNKDPEISERCNQLLPIIATIDRQEKMAALLKDPKSPLPTGLAGLQEFVKIVGDSAATRELYKDIMFTHSSIVEGAAEGTPDGMKEFGSYCTDAYNKWYAATRVGRYSYDDILTSQSDVAMFFFVAGGVSKARTLNENYSQMSIMINSTQIPTFLSGPKASPAIQKLFLNWMINEPQTYLTQQGFQVAANANMKEVLPVALKILHKKENSNYQKAQAAIALVKLGSKDNIKDIESLLKDKTVVGTVNFGNGGQQTIQVRDVAMGVAVQLAGQKPADFGFDASRANMMASGSSYVYYGFPSDEVRDSSHKKWDEWASKNLKK
jgi:hypothetical protein